MSRPNWRPSTTTVLSPRPRLPGPPPPALPAPASTVARRPRCSSCRSAPSRRPRSSSTCATRRSRRCRSSMAKLENVGTDVSSYVFEELAATVQAEEASLHGGVDYARDVLERALGRRPRGRDHRPPVGDDRAPAVRVPAPHAAGADRRLPAQRVAADDRAGHLQPAHDARRPGAVAACPSPSRPRSPCGSRAWARRSPEVVAPGRGRHAPASSPAVVQQEYAAAGGVKSLADILNHADRSTERNVLDALANDRRGARRGGPACCCSSSRTSSSSTTARSRWCCARSTRRTSRSPCAVSATRSASGSSATCPSAARELLREEMEFQPPQRKRVVEEAQGRIVGDRAPPRGGGRARPSSRGEGDVV